MKVILTILCLAFCLTTKGQYYTDVKIDNISDTIKWKIGKLLTEKDSVKLIETYSNWYSKSKPIAQRLLNQEAREIKEAYKLFPSLVEAIRLYYVDEKPNKNSLFIYIPNSIRVDICKDDFPFLDLTHHYLKKKTIAERRNPDITELQMRTKKFADTSVVHPIIIKNFRPISPNDSSKFVYDDIGYEQVFKLFMKRELIADAIFPISQDYKHENYNEKDINAEYLNRLNFYCSVRVNICDRVKRIVFDKNLVAAFVEINTGTSDCCRTLTLLFEKKNNVWEYIALIDSSSNMCGHITCKIK